MDRDEMVEREWEGERLMTLISLCINVRMYFNASVTQVILSCKPSNMNLRDSEIAMTPNIDQVL